MSYKTYTTEAIVCGSRVNNTSDKSFLLFTRDAGMLWATAKSVREERSKQRFALQDFSLMKVSLVRGKSGWRIGSAESEINFFTQASEKERRTGVTRLIRLLRQFLHGEVSHLDLFADTKEALSRLSSAEVEDADRLLAIYTLRLLHRLGYVADEPELSEYLNNQEWWKLPPLPERARKAIENAKTVSHL